MSEPSTDDLVGVLRASHERLSAAFAGLGEQDLTRQSACDEWTIAQVASHLGSGTEIFHHYLDAGSRGEPAPGNELNQPIWDAWNARPPAEQVRDALAVNAAFLEAVADLDESQRAAWRLELYGMDLDLAAFVRMRISEHAVHTWDVTSALDPASTLPEDAAALISDGLGMVAQWGGKASEEPASVEVRTTSPERAYHLDLGPSGVVLSPSLDDTSAASLSLTTEAFVRLVYGRLDRDHTPATVSASGVDLDLLRRAFPGL
ncbi:MAG: maleylpyruvate isomerase family mycothiol-dependent enzyme [Nocardioides sp.]